MKDSFHRHLDAAATLHKVITSNQLNRLMVIVVFFLVYLQVLFAADLKRFQDRQSISHVTLKTSGKVSMSTFVEINV